MNSTKILTLFCVSSLLFACATTHPGNEGHVLTPNTKMPIKISAKNIENNSEDAFQLIEVTIENEGDDWLRINHSDIIINNPAESKVSAVLGKDLKDWASAMDARIKKDNYNRKLLQTGLAVAGAAAMASSKKGSTAEGIGAAAFLGSTAWAVTDVLSSNYNTATQVANTPENHLYQPFAIPSKMFVRRWILLNRPAHRQVNNLVVQFETVESEKVTYEIPL